MKKSYWIESTYEEGNYKSIDKDYEAEVCIIGAGICGLSTGYYLAKSGLKVIVVDKDYVGTKASGHTTAKITLQHGLIYEYLINSFGKEFAHNYFFANKNAISNIKKIIDEENLNCDFEYQSNYVYTTEQSEVTRLLSEVKAINSIARRRICFVCYKN